MNRLRPFTAASLLLLLFGMSASDSRAAGDHKAYIKVEDAGKEYKIQGEYVGEIAGENGPHKVGVQVIALGGDKFEAVVYHGGLPGDGWDPKHERMRFQGALENGVVVFKGDAGTGRLVDGVITVTSPDDKKLGDLKHTERKSPTLGAKPPAGAVVLFDGTSADAFEGGKLTDDHLLAGGCLTKQDFGDFQLHAEFETPFMPTARGQERGNSGIYLQNRYEIQVLDSFGLNEADRDCGAFYQIKSPEVNMCYPPLTWQTYDIDFTAARYDDAGKKIKNPTVTAKHNGVTICENLELPKITSGGEAKGKPGVGPLQFQEHGTPVRYRNIWVVEKK